MADMPAVSAPVPQFKGKLGTLSGNVTYIKAKEAIDWFREKYPPEVAGIHSDLVSRDPIIFRAEIWMGGELVASAHAGEVDGKARDLRKIETAAIARAVGFCGFSREAVLRLQAEAVAAAQNQPREKVDVEKAKATMGAGKDRRLGAVPPVPSKETPVKPPQPSTSEITQDSPSTSAAPVETHGEAARGQETSVTDAPADSDKTWTDEREMKFAENLLSYWDITVDDAGNQAQKYRAAYPGDYKEAWLACCEELSGDSCPMLADELTYSIAPNTPMIVFKSAYKLEYAEGALALAVLLGEPDLADLIKLQEGPVMLPRKARIFWTLKTRQSGENKGKAYYQALRVEWVK